jgi:hypothetical protein
MENLWLIPWCIVGCMVMIYSFHTKLNEELTTCVKPIIVCCVFLGMWMVLCIIAWPSVLLMSLIIKKPEKNPWINILETKIYPAENETVWLYNENDKSVWLGCYVYIQNEGWFWAVSNGIIYAKDGQIITEAEVDDEYLVTHWCPVPNLPKN